MKYQLILFLLCSTLTANAQYIMGIGTKWSDEFTEWAIYTDDEEIEGEITMRWQMQMDWTEWEYKIGDSSGSIRMKWKDNPNQWEISGAEELITARTLWNGDVTQWRITNNSQTITLQSRWSNNLYEWRLKNEKYGAFDVVMNWEGDPREWNVEDDLDEEISLDMKVAILFIITFHNAPK